ncbi:MAG: hypothetical protein ABIV07_00720 [Polaromonas sp.]
MSFMAWALAVVPTMASAIPMAAQSALLASGRLWMTNFSVNVFMT